MEPSTLLSESHEFQPKRKISGILHLFTILFLLLLLYFSAHFKRDILPNLQSFDMIKSLIPEVLPVILFEIIYSGLFVVLLLASIICFVRKSRKFRSMLLILLVFYSVAMITDYWWFNAMADYATPEIAEQFNAPFRQEIYRSLLLDIVYIPFILLSKRVRSVFV
ncbi:DUF2569 family protein [Paenibacillus sp. HN-1]|uniref:DUF2569 family protein n=1 Tax=Paenibacillus TaxID=44249 RepID=UPI001CA8F070|nr:MULTISPECIES: DUF2569 family protein [Paenibacillus]MBY9080225.1 DUF2569 family protein [Paenibacillus sp. CGMCC 1.18879]MBY9083116.1 DUF2569 family protein [Paenibacillus sinensis]